MYPSAKIVNFSKESPIEALKRKFNAEESSFSLAFKFLSGLKEVKTL